MTTAEIVFAIGVAILIAIPLLAPQPLTPIKKRVKKMYTSNGYGPRRNFDA